MSIYYISNSRSDKFIMSDLESGTKTIPELREIIKSHPEFCRDEKSITGKELQGYLSSGITLYALNGEDVAGILNFEINPSYIYIYGICVPPPSAGIGTALIDAVKRFARTNSIKEIKLTCYDSGVADFYSIRNGFRIIRESRVGDDSDDEEDKPKTKYDMRYVDIDGGKKSIRKTRTLKTKRNKGKKNKTRKNMIRKNKRNTRK